MSEVALVDIAAQINAAHAAMAGAFRTGFSHAIECGRLLARAKAALPHGEWLAWLEANTSVSPRLAQMYMRAADNAAEIEAKAKSVSHLTLSEALRLMAKPAPEQTTPEGSPLDPPPGVRVERDQRPQSPAQKELEAAIRCRLQAEFEQEKRKLQAELEQEKLKLQAAFQEERRRREQAESTLRAQQGATRVLSRGMPRQTYRLIRSCLHPDRITDPGLKEKYTAAFQAFSELEPVLCRDEASTMPRDPSDWKSWWEEMHAGRRRQRPRQN
jgi:hypothetical protein